jgi:hypothetical protein
MCIMIWAFMWFRISTNICIFVWYFHWHFLLTHIPYSS